MDRDRYRDLFAREARRLLDEAEGLLGSPGPRAAQERMRLLHTLKGMAATMSVHPMVAVAHAAESLSEGVLAGRLAPGDEVDVLIGEAIDRIRLHVEATARGEEPPPPDGFEARVAELLRTGGTFAFQLLRTVDDTSEPPALHHAARALGDAQGALAEVLSASRRLRALCHTAEARAEVDRIDATMRQLYDQLVGLRSVPFASVVPSLRRHVRAVATRQGKRATLVISGEGVEVDEALLARLTGPLSALCANAVVHGIEGLDERRRVQKAPQGRIGLTAENVGRTLVIQVDDDGAGFDTQALGRGGADPRASAFAPGVSTAAHPDADAGRGMGLVGVRHAVDAMAGSLTVESRPGRGTRVRIVVPVLADLMAMYVVEVGSYVLGLRAATVDGVAEGDGAPGVLGLTPHARVTLRLADGRTVGVDRVIEEAELLVSAPPFPLNRLPWVRGTSVAPDGRILLVVEV